MPMTWDDAADAKILYELIKQGAVDRSVIMAHATAISIRLGCSERGVDERHKALQKRARGEGQESAPSTAPSTPKKRKALVPRSPVSSAKKPKATSVETKGRKGDHKEIDEEAVSSTLGKDFKRTIELSAGVKREEDEENGGS